MLLKKTNEFRQSKKLIRGKQNNFGLTLFIALAIYSFLSLICVTLVTESISNSKVRLKIERQLLPAQTSGALLVSLGSCWFALKAKEKNSHNK